MTLYLRYAAKSDVGMVRKANEDSGFAGRSLLAVADGMGGHAAGELASSTAIATLAELDSEDLPTESLLTALDDAIVTSAERIGQFIDADPTRAGMGTTVTAILWRAGRIAVIHVGDSRAYLLRAGELTQITHDHTYVQSLIDAGRITPDEARRHPKRNLLLRAIDGNQVPEGETSMREAQAGDRYLLCSDGLCGVVEDSVIKRTLAEVGDPTAAVTALVDLALEAGAPDNVTAVVADVVTIDDAELTLEAGLHDPVVVGAAGEQRNRAALPGLQFPTTSTGDDRADRTPGDRWPGPPAWRSVSSRQRVSGGGRRGDRSDARAGDGGRHRDDRRGAGVRSDRRRRGAAWRPRWCGRPHRERRGWRPGPARAVFPAPARRRGRGGCDSGRLLVGLAGFLWWLSSQWYVGQTNGYVTISQGVPQQVVGVPLSRVTTTTALEVDELPHYDQSQVTMTIDAGTEAEAQRIVAQLGLKIAACNSTSPPLGCPVATDEPGAPTATPSPSSSFFAAWTTAAAVGVSS